MNNHETQETTSKQNNWMRGLLIIETLRSKLDFGETERAGVVEAGKPSRYLWVLVGMVKSLLRGESRMAGPWLDRDKSFCVHHVQQCYHVQRLFSLGMPLCFKTAPVNPSTRQPDNGRLQ